ncbi:hypothetical protein [Clostridium sp. DJ247]|nr:hypothetical protein [Clostridium sp. DJ247]
MYIIEQMSKENPKTPHWEDDKPKQNKSKQTNNKDLIEWMKAKR